jgi:hypothetical protein
MHIPTPRLHVVRYYGHYASVARARRARDAKDSGEATAALPQDDPLSSAHRRRLRRQWAQMIRRVYEADPLVCDCGATMRVIAFLTDPPVVSQILRHLEGLVASACREAWGN